MSIRSRKATHQEYTSRRLQDTIQVEESQHQQRLETQPNLQSTKKPKKKVAPRGPTMLRQMWTTDANATRKVISVNRRGQPIGLNKATFVEFLGTIARNPKFTPLHIKDWRNVTEEMKADMIQQVKDKYDIPPGSEHWILKSIRKKRRSWRNTVKTLNFDATLPIEDQISSKPDRVTDEQWKDLLSYWAEKKTQEISEKIKSNRELLVTHPTSGKRSFAEKEEEFRQLAGHFPSRVDLYYDCYGNSKGLPPNETVAAQFAKFTAVRANLPDDFLDPIGRDDIFSQVMGKDPPGRFGGLVLLKSLQDSSKIVAKGVLRSLDPNGVVGGQRLGKSCCEVFVEMVMEWDEEMVRPYLDLTLVTW
ncbi:OLC1v1001195C1 [Oldenlandia corymbosa var. corymbosa]|uniref:OLC1v1001195C1 n=1 Tax=Oldenlandia corymbosa var. corymbosa TaxID=529605 RepID=A0AAV1D6E0_OLDCO|nr:OLC1v1001195C1 [Oldenlandia corymbosa var. corymbosa]